MSNDTDDVDKIVAASLARKRRRYWIERGEAIKLAKCRRRNHPKRHSENRERSIAAKAKALGLKDEGEKRYAAYRKKKMAIRAYWLGELDQHP